MKAAGLPPDFDMLYGIKTKQDIKTCWDDGGSGRMSATRMELIWLCRHHEIDIVKIVGPYTIVPSGEPVGV
jgi:hypothetical protein